MEHLLQRLGELFPADNFVLLLALVGLPLIGAVVNGVFGKRLGKQAVTLMALVAVGGSFLASVLAFFLLAQHQHGEEATRFVWKGWQWMSLSGRQEVEVPVSFALSIDALSATMALLVTGVGFLIHVYSTKYMEHDPGYTRFFAYLNLFIFSMLVLILGDNLPMLFIGWEGVGLCSYLLIGFWYQDHANASAGKKAFITNRVGDFGLLVAMAMFVYYVGALDWHGLEIGRTRLLMPIQIWPLGNSLPMASSLPSFLAFLATPVYISVATLAGLALFLGCAGKSAQIPLYIWLPDAMAGPTPVSALIHAATMVTAGVYLVCRLAGIFVLSPFTMFVMALVGVLTALLAATIALVQTDIKKVLAYSTVSQLGYMFLGVGVGAFSAGFYHVLTHAFFKACLFLGAGSVIHAMHARIHGTDASQDLRNMGGLRRYMPWTYATFGISVLCIAGFPLTSGFFSKDEILYRALTTTIGPPVPGGALPAPGGEMALFVWPAWFPTFLFVAGVLGALMTAFYMARLFFGIFWGDFQGWTVIPGLSHSTAHPEEDHADEHAHSNPTEGPEPQESPSAMTIPLAILAGLALLGGVLNPAQLAVVGIHSEPLAHWLEPVFASAGQLGELQLIQSVPEASRLVPITIAVSVMACIAGLAVAFWVYVMAKGEPARKAMLAAPGLHRFALNKWYVDELYQETIIGAVEWLADVALWIDRWVVDGIISGVSSTLVAAFGTVLRVMQTGRVQLYAFAMVVGLGGLGWFYAVPHAEARSVADPSGNYRLLATPGLGYSYRWDGDGDGQWDEEEFSGQSDLSFRLEPQQARTVKLEVKNAFGWTRSRVYEFVRPPLDAGKAGAMMIEIGADGVPRPRLVGGGPKSPGAGQPSGAGQPAAPGAQP